MIAELVSVIIPVYNVLPYLREALDSVINQTYQNLEIIIIDDGSTDGSAAICDEYAKDTRVKVIHQKNKGLSGARNTGLDLMTGSYVAFLDSDDAYFPDMIQVMIEAIKRIKVDLVTCGFKIVQGDYATKFSAIRTGNDEQLMTSAEALNSLIVGGISFAVWNKVYKSGLWKDLRFSEGYVHEDVEVTYRLLERSSKVLLLSRILMLYRIRENSISNTYSQKNTMDYLRAWEILNVHVEQNVSGVFKEDSVRLFRENKACSYCMRYVETRHLSDSSDVSERLRVEALKLWNSLGRHSLSLKTSSLLFLLKYAPGLILPARACYRILKRFRGKDM